MAINKTDNVGSVEEESTVKAEPTKKISKITDNEGKTEVVQEKKGYIEKLEIMEIENIILKRVIKVKNLQKTLKKVNLITWIDVSIMNTIFSQCFFLFLSYPLTFSYIFHYLKWH